MPCRGSPAHTRVRELELAKLMPVGLGLFAIRESETDGETRTMLPADVASCSECRHTTVGRFSDEPIWIDAREVERPLPRDG